MSGEDEWVTLDEYLGYGQAFVQSVYGGLERAVEVYRTRRTVVVSTRKYRARKRRR